MIQRMLPICTHYACLEKFVYTHSFYEHGMCYHAFCASLKELLNVRLFLPHLLPPSLLILVKALARSCRSIGDSIHARHTYSSGSLSFFFLFFFFLFLSYLFFLIFSYFFFLNRNYGTTYKAKFRC